VPTLDGMRTLPSLLDAVAAQAGAAPEIVAVDSGSRDGTPGYLRSRGVIVEEIPPSAFDHGETRNVGVRRASGDLVVLTVQDARPAGTGWLAALTAPFEADTRLAGTFARQVPAPGASALTRWSLARWTAAAEQPRIIGPLDARAFQAMTPAARHDACVFDNVCSCIRRTAWQQHPFKPAPIAEDLEWARDVLLDGWRIGYVPEAVVEHSHDRPARYEWRRTYLVHRRLQELFGLSTIPTRASLAASVARTLPAHLRVVRGDLRSPRAIARVAALAIAWPAGQYFGARDARRGVPPRVFKGI